ncbi:MAG: response regulator [Deltaproteobacteria bacterium]|nr:response regulator [Deltaproteobacteria bacterium]
MIERDAKKILVVDDDAVIRELCGEALSAAGYLVDIAGGGMEARERIREEDYDLVVSDVCMPGMDGIALYEAAVKESAHLRERFLFITGEMSEELQLIFSRMNLKYLWKPFRLVDFLNCVDAMTCRPIGRKGGSGIQCARGEVRLVLQKECGISENGEGKITKARSIDISRNGMRLLCEGAPLKKEAILRVRMNVRSLTLMRSARVVWSRPVDEGGSMAGLRFCDAVSVSPVPIDHCLRQAG